MATRRRPQTRTKEKMSLESNDEIEEETDPEPNKRKSVGRYRILTVSFDQNH